MKRFIVLSLFILALGFCVSAMPELTEQKGEVSQVTPDHQEAIIDNSVGEAFLLTDYELIVTIQSNSYFIEDGGGELQVTRWATMQLKYPLI